MTCQSQTWPKHAVKDTKYCKFLLWFTVHFLTLYTGKKSNNRYVPAVWWQNWILNRFLLFQYLINKRPVLKQQETHISIEGKSCIAFSFMVLVCIRSYLKSVLRHHFLNLDAYHPETAYLLEQGCEDPSLFFADKGVAGKTWLGNADVEDGSAKSVRTERRGKSTIGRSGRIFLE